MDKKEVDLGYLLEYSKNATNDKLLYIDEHEEAENSGKNNEAEEEDISTVNSYTMTEETKNTFYDSSKSSYWLEIIKYILFGNQQNFIYPLHFRKNAKRIRRIFYIAFFCSMSTFLMWGAIMFLMIKNDDVVIVKETTDVLSSVNKTVTSFFLKEGKTITPEYYAVEYEYTVTPTFKAPLLIPKPPVPAPKKIIIKPVPQTPRRKYY